MRRNLTAVFLTMIIGLSSGVFAQQSTTGPEPPPGLDMGLNLEKNTNAQVVISGVPTYIWHHGCGPTALGMVVLKGFQLRVVHAR